jgi:hypothetical protein
MADVTVHFVPSSVGEKVLRALITKAGGERVDPKDWQESGGSGTSEPKIGPPNGLSPKEWQEPKAADAKEEAVAPAPTTPADNKVVKPRLRVLDPNGRSVADNQVIRGTRGYPGPVLPSWSETPSHLGVISLAKLAAGTHWLLVRGDPPTVLRLELPAAEEMIERRLRPCPGLIGKNLDAKVAVEAKDGVEIIRIEIHNRTAETIKLTEVDIELMTAITEPGADAHVLSPLWSKFVAAKALRETTIQRDQTATLRLDWADWVKHGFWFSRDGERIAEPTFPQREPGRTWVRVTQFSAMPVSVTHPDKIASGGHTKVIRK